jgi:phospholipid/cholesterol/gamma-HCH transport system substrate-binding protein
MNERTMQFRVGVTILAAILCAAILVLLFMGESPLFRGTYTIYIKFSDAPGVSRDTPVRKAGIRIGRVRNVQFADDDSGVIVTAEIDKDRTLYNNEQCKAANSLLMGDATLEFVRNPAFHGDKEKIENGAVLQGEVPSDMTASIAGLQGKVAQALATLETTGRKIDMVVTRADRLLETNEQQITQTIGDAHETMHILRSEMPVILDETKTTMKRMDDTFTSLNRNIESIVKDFDKSLEKLNQLSDNMLQFSEKLKDPRNSLGALLNDKELYQHVTNMASNLDELTGKLYDPKNSLGALLHDDRELYLHVNHIAKNFDELSSDLKPILNNLGILSDKLARHPSTLGVRGALEKESGLKNNPTNDGMESEPPQTRRWPLGGSGQWSFGNQQ